MTDTNRSSLRSQVVEVITKPFILGRSLLPSFNLSIETTLTLPGGPQILHLRAHIGTATALPALSASTTTKPRTPSFPQFMKLPLEVRAMIWKLSFGPPRVFVTKDKPAIQDLIPMVVNHKPPPATQACKEAREVSLQVGAFCFGVQGGNIKSLWFRRSEDVFYWKEQAFEFSRFHEREDDGSVGYCMHYTDDIKNVAIDFKNSHLEALSGICNVSCLFPNCRNLLVVLPHKSPGDHDIRFFYTREEDDPYFEVPDMVLSWALVRDEILEAYGELNDDDNTKLIEKYPPPKLYAVEAIPVRRKPKGSRFKDGRIPRDV